MVFYILDIITIYKTYLKVEEYCPFTFQLNNDNQTSKYSISFTVYDKTKISDEKYNNIDAEILKVKGIKNGKQYV